MWENEIKKEIVTAVFGITAIAALTAVAIITINSVNKQSDLIVRENDNIEKKKQECNIRIKKGKKNIDELIKQKEALKKEISDLEKKKAKIEKDSKEYVIDLINKNL